jgi:hypothetical protein
MNKRIVSTHRFSPSAERPRECRWCGRRIDTHPGKGGALYGTDPDPAAVGISLSGVTRVRVTRDDQDDQKGPRK